MVVLMHQLVKHSRVEWRVMVCHWMKNCSYRISNVFGMKLQAPSPRRYPRLPRISCRVNRWLLRHAGADYTYLQREAPCADAHIAQHHVLIIHLQHGSRILVPAAVASCLL